MAGYTTLASMMGTHPEAAIVRRFGSLNAQNILYLQAELTALELELKRDWRTLSESLQTQDGNPEQWKTMLRIREKLKEYNEAILQQTLILKCESPNIQDLRFLQFWMQNPSMGNVYLLGPDSDIWENPDLCDLVSLKRRENHSPISRLLSDSVIRWYHQLVGRFLRKPDGSPLHANTVYYSQGSLLYISTLIGTVVASILPVVSTIVLYSVESMKSRLALIGIFTAIFSASLGVFTNGRIIEIFSATAAFAAVQVVFVGTTSGSYPG